MPPTASYTAALEFVHNILHGHTAGVLLKKVADYPRFLFVDHQLSIDGFIAIRHRAAAKLSLGDILALAALDFLFQVKGIVFGGGFQQGFQKDRFIPLAHVFHSGNDPYPILL